MVKKIARVPKIQLQFSLFIFLFRKEIEHIWTVRPLKRSRKKLPIELTTNLLVNFKPLRWAALKLWEIKRIMLYITCV